MIGMLLNVVHGQVQNSQRKHITKESKGFHNHSTLILILEFDLNIWFRASGPEKLTRLWRLPWQEPCPALPWATGTILRLTHSWLGLCPKQFALSWLLTYLVPRSLVDEAVNKRSGYEISFSPDEIEVFYMSCMIHSTKTYNRRQNELRHFAQK